MSETYAWCTETLIKHSLYALDIYSKCFEKENIKVLSKRMCLSPDLLPLLRASVKMSIALHDIGKAHSTYQERMKVRGECQYEGKNEVNCSHCTNRPRYFNHEALSAYIYWHVYDELRFIDEIRQVLLNPIDLFSILRKIFTLTIIQHHHAMRGVSELPRMKEPYGYHEKMIEESTLNLIEKLLEASLKPIFPAIYIQILQRCRNRILHYGWPSWYKLRKELEGALLPRAQLDTRLKLYTILSGPLCICDNLSAHLNRPSPALRGFLNEALRVYPCLSKWRLKRKTPYKDQDAL